jgi:radical SAM protein with 4Fe4S-binding SPASM domain
MIAINHDADVTLCCLDPKAFNLLGNLKKDSLVDILNSEKYISLCKDLKDHRIRSELCARCDYRTRFSS